MGVEISSMGVQAEDCSFSGTQRRELQAHTQALVCTTPKLTYLRVLKEYFYTCREEQTVSPYEQQPSNSWGCCTVVRYI